MILDDLLKMPSLPPILVEGPRLFPSLVCPLVTDPSQAIWLLPTEEIVRANQEKRVKPRDLERFGDPERYRSNFLGRERLLREYIRGEVKARDLPSIEVDGSRTPEQIADEVQAHFEGGL